MILDERIPTEEKEIQKAKQEKADKKDDIIKIEDFDKIKADSNDNKEEKGKDKEKKTGKAPKAVGKKLFNRRSGER
jgi:hypothetical protein